MVQQSKGRRRGDVFPVRIVPEVRETLELACSRDDGPKRLGPWLIWRALVGSRAPQPGNTPPAEPSSGITSPGQVIPARAVPAPVLPDEPPISERLIVDLCAGSGSWSEPYRSAGYRVRRFTLPEHDVRELPAFEVPVWGILAAPPCTEFSLAKNGRERDFRAGLEVVSACVRLITASAPRWWAIENPVGLLGRFLGPHRHAFQPTDYGDPWTKRTALWGRFAVPPIERAVRPIDGGGPLCSICYPDAPRSCDVSDHRAMTPPGFARAFYVANP